MKRYRNFINSQTMLCFASGVMQYAILRSYKEGAGDNGIFVVLQMEGTGYYIICEVYNSFTVIEHRILKIPSNKPLIRFFFGYKTSNIARMKNYTKQQ